MPASKPATIVGQIHGSKSSSTLLKLRWSDGNVDASVKIADSNGKDGLSILKYKLGEFAFDEKIAYNVTLANGVLYVATKYGSMTHDYLDPSYKDTAFDPNEGDAPDAYYFKVGNYCQCNADPEDAPHTRSKCGHEPRGSRNCIVNIYEMATFHSGCNAPVAYKTPRYPPRAEATCDAFWLNETTIADGDAGDKAGSAEETASGNGVDGEGEVADEVADEAADEVADEAAESAAAIVGTVWGWFPLERLAGVVAMAGLACV